VSAFSCLRGDFAQRGFGYVSGVIRHRHQAFGRRLVANELAMTTLGLPLHESVPQENTDHFAGLHAYAPLRAGREISTVSGSTKNTSGAIGISSSSDPSR